MRPDFAATSSRHSKGYASMNTNRDLCLQLLQADSGTDVIKILKAAGYWDNPMDWRFYGDNENNFSTIGNQQSRSDAALVEKLVNAVDARLMNECMIHGIDPEGPNAPQTIRDAVARFFDETVATPSSVAGLIQEWPNKKRTDISRGITLAATGTRSAPSLSIFDCGEGQTPSSFPTTILSLNKSNKLRIPFVQGKFNMGGTGALKFCGKHHLQLIISRRNPKLNSTPHLTDRDGEWGFTLIRREAPQDGARSSMYTYLAPVDVRKGRDGAILSFESADLPIRPRGNNAYTESASWGTLIKLYEYQLPPSERSHILRRDGLLSKTNLLLPEVGLPMRFHECRDFGGAEERSFENSVTGLRVRLDENRGGNLEPEFPVSTGFRTNGEDFIATIYAFKTGAAASYRRNEGIIFTVNGQTHGHLTIDFFRRTRVGLSHLADSLLIIVDCSKLSIDAKEDLFMNSRDRLSNGELKTAIERELQDLLKGHAGLRQLRERRRREQVEERLTDDKPLEEVLKSLVRRSPTLATLFLSGGRASNPFKSRSVAESESDFVGVRHPNYFKFLKLPYGQHLKRDCHIGQRFRVLFETDAANDYFSRDIDTGEQVLEIISDSQWQPVTEYALNLYNGVGALSVILPFGAEAGDHLSYRLVVSDPTRAVPFTNQFDMTIRPETSKTSGGNRRRNSPGPQSGSQRDTPWGIELPKRRPIHEPQWATEGFTPTTAVKALHQLITDKDGTEHDSYEFLINMDNIHLKRFLKEEAPQDEDTRIFETQFDIGLVLIGLAIIHHANQTLSTPEHEDEDEINVLDQVAIATEAIAPIILPLIAILGSLDPTDDAVFSGAGEPD